MHPFKRAAVRVVGGPLVVAALAFACSPALAAPRRGNPAPARTSHVAAAPHAQAPAVAHGAGRRVH